VDCDVEITFRIKEFCSSQSTSDFLLCEMSTVLRGLFFLMINCLFGCFDRILVLSVEGRCHLMSARGTGNFDILFISSGNRHKFTSMCLAGTSLYQRCLLPDEIPSAPNSPYQASALRRSVPIFCQTWKRRFLS